MGRTRRSAGDNSDLALLMGTFDRGSTVLFGGEIVDGVHSRGRGTRCVTAFRTHRVGFGAPCYARDVIRDRAPGRSGCPPLAGAGYYRPQVLRVDIVADGSHLCLLFKPQCLHSRRLSVSYSLLPCIHPLPASRPPLLLRCRTYHRRLSSPAYAILDTMRQKLTDHLCS